MSYKLKHLWGAAIEDSLDDDQREAPVAEFNIEVSETAVDDDGAPLEAVDAEGGPTLDVLEPEVMESAGEVDDAADTVEQLEKTQETLESFRAVIENRIKYDNGIEPGELQFLMIGVESRLPVREGMFPSVEDATTNRLQAATLALESIKAGIRQIWDRIVDAIKNMYAKVRNWWVKTLGAAPRLKKRAEGIAKKASRTSGSMSNKKITLSVNRTICADDLKGYKDGPTAVKYIEHVSKIANVVLRDVTQVDIKAFADSDDAIGNIIKNTKTAYGTGGTKDEGAAIKKAFAEANAILKNFTSGYTTINGFEDPATGTKDSRYSNIRVKVQSDPTPGSKSFVLLGGIESPTSGAHDGDGLSSGDITKHWRNMGLRLVEFDTGKKSAEGSADYATLSTAEVQDVCTHVITIADAILEYKKGWEDREKGVKNALKAIDREIKDLDKDDTFDSHANIRTFISANLTGFRSYVTDSTGANTQAITYLFSVAKAYLLYSMRSLAQYKR